MYVCMRSVDICLVPVAAGRCMANGLVEGATQLANTWPPNILSTSSRISGKSVASPKMVGVWRRAISEFVANPV